VSVHPKPWTDTPALCLLSSVLCTSLYLGFLCVGSLYVGFLYVGSLYRSSLNIGSLYVDSWYGDSLYVDSLCVDSLYVGVFVSRFSKCRFSVCRFFFFFLHGVSVCRFSIHRFQVTKTYAHLQGQRQVLGGLSASWSSNFGQGTHGSTPGLSRIAPTRGCWRADGQHQGPCADGAGPQRHDYFFHSDGFAMAGGLNYMALYNRRIFRNIPYSATNKLTKEEEEEKRRKKRGKGKTRGDAVVDDTVNSFPCLTSRTK
jgi:hypothetical protein